MQCSGEVCKRQSLPFRERLPLQAPLGTRAAETKHDARRDRAKKNGCDDEKQVVRNYEDEVLTDARNPWFVMSIEERKSGERWRKSVNLSHTSPLIMGCFRRVVVNLTFISPFENASFHLSQILNPPKKNCSDALACVLHAFSVVFQMCAISFQWFSFIFSCGFSCFSATFQLLFSYFSLIPWGYFWKTWSVVLVFCLKKWVNFEG